MAMLAAPRRKQKVINLRAKNNAWSNDSNKFGQRMLEKMGWSEGKGLGANENGIVQHVVARYKNDEKGLGFEDRNDQWTKHEDDFNSLLMNLSNGSHTDEKLHSGVSLEVKSKKSKARVHYHKFTRGKDLTRYSDKDLANIFGKKSLKNEEKQEKPQKEDVKTTEQVFTDKGSMEEYFKSKLASFKSNSIMNVNSDDKEKPDCGFMGFSGTGFNSEESENAQNLGFQGFSCYKSEESKVEKENSVLDVCIKSIKKSKKKKKCKNLDEVTQSDTMQEDIVKNNYINYDHCEVKENGEKVKKSKKKNKKTHDQEEQFGVQKTKKVTEIIEENSTEDYVPKKKKKRKNKDRDVE